MHSIARQKVTVDPHPAPDQHQQEFSYRKRIARKLRTQYVDGINRNSMTLKSRLRVTQGHWNWYWIKRQTFSLSLSFTVDLSPGSPYSTSRTCSRAWITGWLGRLCGSTRTSYGTIGCWNVSLSYMSHVSGCPKVPTRQWIISFFGLVFRWDFRWVLNSDWDQR